MRTPSTCSFSDVVSTAMPHAFPQAKLKAVPGGCFVVSYSDCTWGIEFEKQPGDKIRMMLDGVAVILEKEKDPSALQEWTACTLP